MLQVEGARQLRTSLKRAGEDLKQLKEANAAAARIAANASADLAPQRTGRLAGTIRASGTNTAGIVRAGTKRAPYAHAVHWGRQFWPNARHARRARSTTAAQPFLSDGARGSEGQWLPLYEKKIQEIIEKVEGI